MVGNNVVVYVLCFVNPSGKLGCWVGFLNDSSDARRQRPGAGRLRRQLRQSAGHACRVAGTRGSCGLGGAGDVTPRR